MTRETKVGLVVASSFICLVGVVVASKMRPNDASASHSTPAEDQTAQNYPKPTLPSPNEKKSVDTGVIPAKFPKGEVPGVPLPETKTPDVPAPQLSIPSPEKARDGFPQIPTSPNFEEEQRKVMAELQNQKAKPEQVAFADPPPPLPGPGKSDTPPPPPPPARDPGPGPLPPPGLDSGPPTVSPLSIKPKSPEGAPPPSPFGGPPKIEDKGPLPGAPLPSPAAPVDQGPFGTPTPPSPTPPAPLTPGPGPGPTPPPTAAPVTPPFKDPGAPIPSGPDGPPAPIAPIAPIKPPAPTVEAQPKDPFKKQDTTLVPPLGAGNAGNPFGTPGGNQPGLPQVKNFSAQTVFTEPADTSFAALSQRLFNTDKYGQALLQFNRDYNPAASATIHQDPPRLEVGQKVSVPPTDFLESRYKSLIGSGQVIRPTNVPAAGPANPFASNPGNGPPPLGSTPPPLGATVPLGSASPFGANPTSLGSNPPNPTPPPLGSSGPGPLMVRTPMTTPTTDVTKRYRVQNQGQHIIEIARQTLGDGSRWSEIYRLNPALQPQNLIPGGTELKLPATANIP